MIIIENKKIHDIPLLHVVKDEDRQNKLPLIIFIHGFTSAKEHNLHYAYLLADKGFRVILPETLHHGEREQGLSMQDLYPQFWKVILTTIDEINLLKEYYCLEGLVDRDRIGVVGTSMGGITTLGALTQFPWIKAAVSLMGMPAYVQFSLWQLEQLQSQGIKLPFNDEQIAEQLAILRDYDLSLQPERLANRPLLFWHGKKDPLVPYPLAFQFFQSIKNDYSEAPDKLQFITDEHAGHKVSREGLKATVNWFEKYLLH